MNPVLQAIVSAARDVTGASAVWALALDGATLRAVAAAGERAGELIGTELPAGAGTAGYVLGSGQPIALTPRGPDPRWDEGLAGRLGRSPQSLLCVPCTFDDGVLGAIELVDKAGGGAFSFDDVEVTTVLAGIAGAAMSMTGPDQTVRPPSELGAELARVASTDPAAYARVATVLEALLSRG